MQGSRVLIVEDEMLVAMMLEDMVADMGLVVAGVANRLAEGLSYARSLDLDAAVLDVNLDGELSFPIARLLKERSVPFFFATGYGAKGLDEEFHSTLVVEKPFNASDLSRAFSAILQ